MFVDNNNKSRMENLYRFFIILDIRYWVLGIKDWVLGIGDWGLGIRD